MDRDEVKELTECYLKPGIEVLEVLVRVGWGYTPSPSSRGIFSAVLLAVPRSSGDAREMEFGLIMEIFLANLFMV